MTGLRKTDDIPLSSVSMSFPSTAHGVETVKKAAYRFLNIGAVDISLSGDEIVCTMTFHEPKAAAEARRITNDFKIEVLDQDLRRAVAEETAPLRNAILAHAFSKTGLQNE